MNKDYYKPYEGRDIKILDQHAANTIAEDHLTFPYQLLDHLAHVLMLKEQGIISQEDAAQILGAVLKLRREGPDIVPHSRVWPICTPTWRSGSSPRWAFRWAARCTPAAPATT